MRRARIIENKKRREETIARTLYLQKYPLMTKQKDIENLLFLFRIKKYTLNIQKDIGKITLCLDYDPRNIAQAWDHIRKIIMNVLTFDICYYGLYTVSPSEDIAL